MFVILFKERLQACLVQYLSDESSKDEKDGDHTKKTDMPDVILVEDSGDEAVPRKRHRRSVSTSRKLLKTERRVVVDMSRGERRSRDESERQRNLERKREEKLRNRDDIKKDDRQCKKFSDKIKDDSAKKKLDEERRKELMKKEEVRRREHEKRYILIFLLFRTV